MATLSIVLAALLFVYVVYLFVLGKDFWKAVFLVFVVICIMAVMNFLLS